MNLSHQNDRSAHERSGGIIAAAADSTSDSLIRRYELYLRLARQSARAGDEIEAENLLQHAEHYYRTALRKVGHQQ